jgi:hypothetical protein
MRVIVARVTITPSIVANASPGRGEAQSLFLDGGEIPFVDFNDAFQVY